MKDALKEQLFVIIATVRTSKKRKVIDGPMTKQSAMGWFANNGLKKDYKDFRYAKADGATAKACK